MRAALTCVAETLETRMMLSGVVDSGDTHALLRANIACLAATKVAPLVHGAQARPAVAPTITWINAAGGKWDAGANWSTGAIPGKMDCRMPPPWPLTKMNDARRDQCGSPAAARFGRVAT